MTTDPETSRIFTPARVIALVLIVLIAVGLTYIRFAPAEATVTVPSGARAGDLILEPCTFETEEKSYAADCGTLVVPENRTDPDTRLIALPVTRVRAQSARPGKPVFRFQGGPGQSNMSFPNADGLVTDHDLVLVGYRGVDGSVVLDCPEVESALRHSSDLLSDASAKSYAAALGSCADRLSAEGVDLSSYGLVQQVDDMEAAREALGYDTIDLLSESAGTRTAMIYAWRYPGSIHRSVMVGVNPPGNFLWRQHPTDEQFARYADLCSRDGACSKRTDDLAATVQTAADNIPDRWLFLPIKEGNVRFISFFAMMDATEASAPASAPMMLDSWLSATEGDSSGMWFGSFIADFLFPTMFTWGQYAAGGARIDARAADEYFSPTGEDPDSLAYDATSVGWGGGEITDVWPAELEENRYSRVTTSEVETLLIGGELDFSTPPQIATRELLPHLPNGHQVVLPELGHTNDFWGTQPEASTHLINTFLNTGEVDTSFYEPVHVNFTPEGSHTTLAKWIVGIMVGLALFTVLALVWMARRVHWQGHFGSKAAVVLRSALSALLGLGGLFFGTLLTLTTMPSVPFGDELVTVISVSAPVAIAVYLAWVHRDWPARTKLLGSFVVATGALGGAWLGYNAATGYMSMLTAIAGTVAGANLTLIVLDMMQARSARRSSPVYSEIPTTPRDGFGAPTPVGGGVK